MATLFDSFLFMELPAAVESKSLAQFLRPLSINRNTWCSWVKNGDLPLVKMLDVCRHYGYDPALFFSSDGSELIEQQFAAVKEQVDRKPHFRTRLFSDALSLFRHLTVPQACKSIGISTATFARQLRARKKEGAPSLTVKHYLEWCAKAGLNPTDYIYEGEVSVKLDY